MDDMLQLILRTCLLYFVILIVFRIMGKREIGELSLLDLVVFLMIADIAVLGIEDYTKDIPHTLMPIITLLIIQITFAYLSLKIPLMRKVLDGNPTVIIHNGKIDERAMKKIRYNFDDLLMQLREKGIEHMSDIKYAILESSGKLSIYEKDKRKEDDQKPSILVPLVIDGDIRAHNLKEINKTKGWLLDELKKQGFKDIKKLSYCSFQDGQLYVDEKDELFK